MTDRAEIERLLNQTGRTLEGTERHKPIVDCVNAFNERGGGVTSVGNALLHQSDVIELLVAALRDALDKPMQKPLTLEQIADGPVDIEFTNEEVIMTALFDPDNHKYEGMVMYHVLGSATRNYVQLCGYGKYWRCWATYPTDEEREAAAWEN